MNGSDTGSTNHPGANSGANSGAQATAHTTEAATAELSIERTGALGRITLRRAEKLNALTHAMVRAMRDALQRWQHDDGVAMVLVDAEPGKAFCAGGDVTTMYHQGVDGDIDAVRRFFADEYRLNALIARYPKPYVAIMDGITMGGGIGISAHGSHRIVTERSVLAIPECVIGLVPDVGATDLLARAPGHLGECLALSGARLDAADARYAGLADHHVPSERIEALKAALLETAEPSAIAAFAIEPGESALQARAPLIDELFGRATLGEVLDAVSASDAGSDEPWLQAIGTAIRRASPLSLHVALALVRAARAEPGVEAALVREYRVVSRAVEQGDFLEGVRAALIDKDRTPRWRHADVANVDDEALAVMLQGAPGGDVELA